MYSRTLLLAVAGLTCTTASAAEDPIAQPGAAAATVERPARIRLFGQNGVGLTMYTNARCEDEYDEEIEASGSLSHGFKTLVGKKRPNESIGIPETEHTRNLADRDRLLANPYYAEHPLVPGQRVLLEANIASGSGWSCNRGRGIQTSFIPEPGVDYEGDMIRDFQGGSCSIAIRRVSADGGLTPVPSEPLPATCAADSGEVAPLMVMLFEPGRMQYRWAEQGAGIDELDNDDDSVEDFEEMMAEAPIAADTAICIIADDAADSSELGKALPAQLQARGVTDRVLRYRSKALETEWQLTAERPLNFALAEYYCHAVNGKR
ncbi:hypothetical protein [Stenotrophomonas sp. SY1]|uniref:hypothetical protein n=1 Tax=Stenotrophomonas sp. SY1 TaxID=477235 RepID=UPI001E40FA8F|nr:hypothetical protein [Stenotrophomonas sp. SY1]MCD9088266.1 hypothetical protein [Stenotrophomonas sp. SY1]